MSVQVLDINMIPTDDAKGFSKTILKQKEVPGYDSSSYRCCRIFAPSNTSSSNEASVMIPISLVFHKSLVDTSKASDGNLPRNASVLMSGYGMLL